MSLEPEAPSSPSTSIPNGVADDRDRQLVDLEGALAVRFRDRAILDMALRHGSFAHERGQQAESYERLEFLGDAVLNLVVGDYLYRQFPDYPEGQLAKQRARLVSESALAHLCRRLGLGRFILLGKGEEKGGGRHRPSLLADAVEAVLGAIYVDSGYGVAHAVGTRWISQLAEELLQASPDFKSQLQERLQRFRLFPRYRVAREEGPDHAKAFNVHVEVDGRVVGEGHGRSKKEAEQAAAEQALTWIETHPPDRVRAASGRRRGPR